MHLPARSATVGIVLIATVCSSIIALVLVLAQHYTVELPHEIQVMLETYTSYFKTSKISSI